MNYKSLALCILIFAGIVISSGCTDSSVGFDYSKYFSDGNNTGKVIVYFFWGDGCPHCAEQKPFMKGLEEKYDSVEVRSFEVWHYPENASFFEALSEAYDKDVEGVPTTFIDDQVWIGYNSAIEWDIERKVKECVDDGCIDPISRLQTNISLDNTLSAGGVGGDVLKSDDTVSPANLICAHVFIDPTCEPCRNIGPYLDSLSDDYNINLTRHDVTQTGELETFSEFKEKYGIIDVGFPVLFIGDTYLVGQDMINSHLEDEIDHCLDDGCVCPDEYIKGTTAHPPKQGDFVPSSGDVIELPLVGEVLLTDMPLVLSTSLIALVDGFNPCSLWVLTFLLGIVVYSGSRKKVFIVGATFLAVTATAYGLFMIGVINVLRYTMYMTWIQVGVAVIALVFGLVNVKDFFWYKKGVSFTISDKYKPKIFRNVRGIMKSDGSLSSMVFGTAVMALGITLIELPCTAGFPVIWSNILAQNDVGTGYFVLLFAIYMLIYLLDEIAIFSMAVVTLQASHFEEKHGRILKLVGGMIMIALAVALIVSPEMMNDLEGTLIVFGGAVLLSAIVVLIYSRKVGFNKIDSDGADGDDGSDETKNSIESKSKKYVRGGKR